jgi:hypothetical protein
MLTSYDLPNGGQVDYKQLQIDNLKRERDAAQLAATRLYNWIHTTPSFLQRLRESIRSDAERQEKLAYIHAYCYNDRKEWLRYPPITRDSTNQEIDKIGTEIYEILIKR